MASDFAARRWIERTRGSQRSDQRRRDIQPAGHAANEGLDKWEGEKWHTARWPESADLTDKHVAIIGNGASCMQIAPEIQDDVASLTIFQIRALGSSVRAISKGGT